MAQAKFVFFGPVTNGILIKSNKRGIYQAFNMFLIM